MKADINKKETNKWKILVTFSLTTIFAFGFFSTTSELKNQTSFPDFSLVSILFFIFFTSVLTEDHVLVKTLSKVDLIYHFVLFISLFSIYIS